MSSNAIIPKALKTFRGYLKLLAETYEIRPDVPPTRDEICTITGSSKKEIRELVSLGIIREQMVILRENGCRTVGRISYELTELGAQAAEQMGLEVPKPKPKEEKPQESGVKPLPESVNASAEQA